MTVMFGLPFDPVIDFCLQALYSLRIELAFVSVFGLLWLAGQYTELQFGNAKKVSKRDNLTGAASKKRRALPASMTTDRLSRPHPTAMPRADVGGRDRVPISPDYHRPTTTIPVASIEPSLLCDPAWIVPEVTQLCRMQVQRALETYRAAMKAGLDLQQVAPIDCRNLFMALVTSAIRVGQTDEALRLLRDLRERGPGVSAGLLSSATKLCTSKQHFAECLTIYDFVAEDTTLVVDDKSVWSCLLFCAVEAACYQRCMFFFGCLKATGPPSPKDYGNMIRFASMNSECELSLSLVQEMREAGVDIDSVIYNTALATCVSADKVDQARVLLEEMERVGGVADVITYNTLAKGYAKAGRMDQCFELYKHMRSQGIQPSQVTYGILLDGCINENKVDRAAEVFNCMSREGCVMNTVLYTTLIKGFARAGQVDQAMHVYEQMRNERGVPPDLITFSILIKANCDSHRLEAALRLLKAMLDLKLRPDEVVFNNLLGGCVKESNAELAKRLYQDMISARIRPSNATFSILIRLYAQCKLLDEAVEMLKHEPAAQGVSPEPRLYSQLALCCLRERQGRRAIEVYRLMLENASPTAAAHSSMLGMCVKLNMLDTGAEILNLAAESEGRVDARDAALLIEAAMRKKKVQCAEACAAAMARMGLARSAAT